MAFVLGAKLWLIGGYGSDVPYMDQWDAQAGVLYIPHAENRLSASAFFTPHNEHRVVLTRLTNYVLTMANRQWDPLLEMAFNAALHASFAGLLLVLAGRHLRGFALAGSALVIGALFALPFAWENTLAGFQSQFYFMAGTSLGFLWLVLSAEPLDRRWWLGVLIGVAGLGSMSSGFFCAVAALFVTIGRVCRWERRSSWRHLIAATVYLAICVSGLLMMTHVSGHEPLKVTSAGQWFHAMGNVLAWPANHWPAAAFVLHLPLALFLIGRIRSRELTRDEAVLLGLAVWSWSQMAAIAYARGNLGMGNSPRYYDLYAIGIVLNGIALFRGARATASRAWLLVVMAWLAVLTFGLCEQTATAHRDFLTGFSAVKAAERRHLVHFIRTGDLPALSAHPEELPHSNPDLLAHHLSHSGIRTLLPVSLRTPLTIRPAEMQGFRRSLLEPKPGHPDREVWHASRGPARFVSEPLPADTLPVLRFTFIGSAGLPPGVLRLETADGHRSSFTVERIVGTRWQSAHLELPPGENVRIIVELPPGEHDFAFGDPLEMGRGSFYVHHLLKNARGVCVTAAVLFIIALGAIAWRERSPPSLNPASVRRAAVAMF